MNEYVCTYDMKIFFWLNLHKPGAKFYMYFFNWTLMNFRNTLHVYFRVRIDFFFFITLEF